jgi:hypothetical protein
MDVELTAIEEVAIDAHVHIYDLRKTEELLRSAVRNFARVSLVRSNVGVLMLTESAGYDAFAELRRAGSAGTIQLERAVEPELLWASVDGWRLMIVRGRQILSEEGLEVHALGTTTEIADRQPILRLVDELSDLGALIALPWAAGKWLARRRRVLKDLLSRKPSSSLLLSDNGGRPIFWLDPLLDRVATSGIRVLAGSDPLPLPGAHRRVGSFGCCVRLMAVGPNPVEELKTALRDSNRSLRRFGQLNRPFHFLSDQLRLRQGSAIEAASA